MKLKIGLMIFCCLFLLSFQETAAGAETPTVRVRSMLEEVMAIQTDSALQGAAFRSKRKAGIKKIISSNFYFDSMAKQALGMYWEKLDEPGRAEFKALFQDLFQESYTKLVLDFLKQEKILYPKEELAQGQARVKTTIVRLNEEIPVDYSMTLVQGRWLVEDVTIDGVSIVRNYQRSFSRVIQQESYKSLLQKMRLQQQANEKPS